MCILKQRKKPKPNLLIMIIHKSLKGKVEQITDNHFKVTIYSELGYCSYEIRHGSKDEAIYEVEK